MVKTDKGESGQRRVHPRETKVGSSRESAAKGECRVGLGRPGASRPSGATTDPRAAPRRTLAVPGPASPSPE